MKYTRFLVILFFVIISGNLAAQAVNGMSLNGATGLYSIPTGRIGWGQPINFAIDTGYHTVISDNNATHIPKLSMSFFRWVELSAAFDIQPEKYHPDKNRDLDFITGAKIQLPIPVGALALGGNFQVLNMISGNPYRYNAGQIYVALTYGGRFFDWPAESTMVLGKTFRENDSDSHIDFGMGFDLVVLPNFFGNYVHWIADFANFSYSDQAYGAEAWFRGVLNTGFRVDLSVIPVFRRYKFVIDIVMVDALDHNRAFSAGLVFGIPIM